MHDPGDTDGRSEDAEAPPRPSLDDLLAPGSTAGAVAAALVEAGPEAAEHLLRASQELLLAAKAMIDAAERAVEAHQRRPAEPPDAVSSEPPSSNVRRIDLA